MYKSKLMLKNLKLATKLNLILILIFLSMVTICSWYLSSILEAKIQKEVSDKASLIIETMNSVRDYTSTQINPELAPRLETENRFLPETVPAYSAHQVFEGLRKKQEYADFSYREATLNPTNPQDKADEFETSIIEKFKSDRTIQELTGFHTFTNNDFFYIARPLAVSKDSCLRCHSIPEVAPKSLIATYGSKNGFGWRLKEIVATQIVLVPASQVIGAARNLQFLIIGIIIFFFLAAVVFLNFFLKFSIIIPLTKMSQLSKQVSTGNTSTNFKHDANDEIGILAASLNRMKISLEMALNMLDNEQNK